MTMNMTIQSTLSHLARALAEAAEVHVLPHLVRIVDGAAHASAQAAAPVIADAVRAAAPPLGTAARRLARTVGEALHEADRTDPRRRAQHHLEALHASREAARRDLLERPGPPTHRSCKRCAGTGGSERG